MRARALRIALGAVLVAILGAGCNPDKNKLLFKPQPNAKRTVDTEEAMNVSINLAGMNLGFGMSTESTFELTPKTVDDQGTATVEVACRSMGVEVTGLDALTGGGLPGGNFPGMPPRPAGAPANDDPFAMKAIKVALKAIEGETFSVKVNKLGEIVEVNGADAVAEKAAAAFKAPAGAPPLQPKSEFRKLLGDDAMKRTLQNVFVARPDKKLNPGDSWQGRIESGNAMFEVARDTTLTVKGRNGGVVSVEAPAQTSVNLESGFVSQAGRAIPSLKIDISGQSTGTLSFEEQTGWLSESIATGQIPGTISAQIPQMGNFSTPVEVAYKMTVRNTPS